MRPSPSSDPEDHDQRFKTLLEEFIVEFFQLFFPEWFARFDWSRLEWLRSEIFPDPPKGQRRSMDLVARVPVRQSLATGDSPREEQWITLIHIEVESEDRAASIRGRMPEYFWILRHRYGLPVLPIALFLRVGLQGIGWDVYEEWFWEHRLVHFEYAYIGLPALSADAYVQRDNWLGIALAALMRIEPERRAWLKAESMRRLVEYPDNAMRRYLLCEVVQAYLPLEGPQLEQYGKLLVTERYKGVSMVGLTWREEGELIGIRRVLKRQIERRFGPLPEEVQKRLQSLPSQRLLEVSDQLFDAKSLDELGLMEDPATAS